MHVGREAWNEGTCNVGLTRLAGGGSEKGLSFLEKPLSYKKANRARREELPAKIPVRVRNVLETRKTAG